MPESWRYRGREVGGSEVAYLRQLIQEHPELSRYALSRKVCEAWQWIQPNGTLCDMVRRVCCFCFIVPERFSCRHHGGIPITRQKDTRVPKQ